MKTNFTFLAVILFVLTGCSQEEAGLPVYKAGKIDAAASATTTKTRSNRIGNSQDVTKTTTGGFCLMGGGTDVDAAFQWMITKSGGGDFVVIRFDKSTGYNSYIFNLGKVNSVETLIINTSALANSDEVYQKISKAEALFIAGGDQANYVKYWKGTKVQTAINELIAKGVPIGGTSAGCAILGDWYFSAANGTVTSDQALADPYNIYMTLGEKFLIAPILQNTITDQHFSQRSRQGRLVAFMAQMKMANVTAPRGIGVDEQTAVCIDQFGTAQVYGINSAYFLKATTTPGRCIKGQTLNWISNYEAIQGYRITGSVSGNGNFYLNTFAPAGGSSGTSFYYYVQDGVLYTK